MNFDEVLARIAGGEDETTELGRFRTFAEKDWLKAVCAFANTQGGLLVLGVLDDGRVDGVPMDPDDVQEHLTNHLQNALSVPVLARVRRHRDAAGWVHWIEVARMRESQPVRYQERVYVRRGRSSVSQGESELMELYNTFGLVLTEERLLPDTNTADVEFAAYRAWQARRGVDLDLAEPLDPAEDLVRAEILGVDVDGARRASLYGLMCFGREPQRHPLTRGFLVRMAAYAGLDRGADTVSVGDAAGRLDEQVRHVETWVAALGRTETYSGLVRVDRPLVPARALREALVNAVAHRDYTLIGSSVTVDVFDDRVEITSPGALPNHKTAESVMRGGPARSRNQAMADFMLVSNLMEKRGTGYPRMLRAMREFNGTAPGFEANALERWVRVTLWLQPGSP